jgi:hypothetical protein
MEMKFNLSKIIKSRQFLSALKGKIGNFTIIIMEDLNQKIHSNIITIMVVFITVIVTAFLIVNFMMLRGISEGIDDLKFLDQIDCEGRLIVNK